MNKLAKILSISGRPGLYNLVNQGKNCLIVESLTEQKKRMPIFNQEKVMSLGDIAIYTDTSEKPLSEIFEIIKEKFGIETIDVKSLEVSGKFKDKFEEVLPDFDKERVKTSDIKKVFGWYNTLIANGITEFADEEDKTVEPELTDNDNNVKESDK